MSSPSGRQQQRQHTTLTSPRTPKKKSSNSSTSISNNVSNNVSNRSIKSPGAATILLSPTYVPDGWERKRVFYVYQKPKDETIRIKDVIGKNQGVWTQGYVSAQSPQEVWAFTMDNAPPVLLGQIQDDHDAVDNGGKNSSLSSSSSIKSASKRKQHIHGVWGYKPGTDDAEVDPNDVWFYPPDFKTGPDDRRPDAKALPRYFTVRGVWTYPLIKKNVSEIAPEMTGWLGIGETAKVEKLDVAGTWKMLYRQDGAGMPPVETKGPGMKPRTPKGTPKSTPTSSPKKPVPIPVTINITVVTPDGNEIPMVVRKTQTVDQLKDRLWDELDIPKVDQRLVLPNGQPMEDVQKTLKSYGIEDGNKVRLGTINVIVKQLCDGRTFEVSGLLSNTTIGTIKDKIASDQGIDKDDQLLSYDEEILKDKLTLRDYKIQHGATLELEEMEVTVIHDNEEFTVTVTPHDTIKKVKMRIEKEKDIPQVYQRLKFNEKKLDDDSRTLKDYRVPHQGCLVLDQSVGITILKPNGDQMPLKVIPTDTIRDVKEKILLDAGIPINEQRLKFGNNDELRDARTISDCGIHHGDILDLDGMMIHVRHSKNKNKQYAFDGLDPTTTIHELKEMLTNRYGLPKDDIRLSFDGVALDTDNQMLRQYGIVHQSTLDCEPMQVKVVTPEGKEVTVIADPKDTILELKKRVQEDHGIPVNDQRLMLGSKPLKDPSTLRENKIRHGSLLTMDTNMRVTVQHWDGTTFQLNVEPQWTIDIVKDKIETKTGLDGDVQRIVFQGKSLDDGKRTLRGYNIRHKDVLELEPMFVTIVTRDGRNIHIPADPTESVARMKEKIEDKTRVPSNQQRLIHNGLTIDDDKKTLGDYRIKHGSTIVMQPMEVTIRTPDGRNLVLQVDPHDTIASLKVKVEALEGICPTEQQLMKNGKCLIDSKTLSEYGIVHGTTMDLGGMQIFIQHYNGNTLTLPVSAKNSIYDVKRMVQDSEGTPTVFQNFFFGTQWLEDDRRSLSDYKIYHGSTLKMEQMKIYVDCPTGKFPLSMNPTTTVLGLKDMIEKKTTFKRIDQVVKFKGEQLTQDVATMVECQIKHRDTIQVDVQDPLMYKVVLGNYQSAFSYSPSPKKKREGIRARRTAAGVADLYETTSTDREVSRFTHTVLDDSL
jgi:hypothetical protein